jgi:hypothetical protein
MHSTGSSATGSPMTHRSPPISSNRDATASSARKRCSRHPPSGLGSRRSKNNLRPCSIRAARSSSRKARTARRLAIRAFAACHQSKWVCGRRKLSAEQGMRIVRKLASILAARISRSVMVLIFRREPSNRRSKTMEGRVLVAWIERWVPGRLETIRIVCDALIGSADWRGVYRAGTAGAGKAPAVLTCDGLLLFCRSPQRVLCVPLARNLSCARGYLSVVIAFLRRSDP